MNPVTQHLSKDPQPWIELLALLRKAESDLPKSDWRPVLAHILVADPDARRQIKIQLVAAYGEPAEPIVRASIRRAKGEGWPNLKPSEVFFLREMLLRAIDFVERLLTGRGEKKETIFEFPCKNLGEVFIWLLTDWWLEDGLHRMAEDALRDAIGKSKYYSIGDN